MSASQRDDFGDVVGGDLGFGVELLHALSGACVSDAADLAMNPPARALYSPVLNSAAAGASAKRPANTTRFLYLDPSARAFFVDYGRVASDAAAMLRLEAGRNPHDKDLITRVGDLSTHLAGMERMF